MSRGESVVASSRFLLPETFDAFPRAGARGRGAPRPRSHPRRWRDRDHGFWPAPRCSPMAKALAQGRRSCQVHYTGWLIDGTSSAARATVVSRSASPGMAVIMGDSGPSTTVGVHYSGWRTTASCSTRRPPGPAGRFANQVIAGWTEGLQLMSPGARTARDPASRAMGPAARTTIFRRTPRSYFWSSCSKRRVSPAWLQEPNVGVAR